MDDVSGRAPQGRGVDVVEVLRATFAVGAERVDNLATTVRRLRAGEPPRQVLSEALDRNEELLSDLAERWRAAGVAWPWTLLATLAAVIGVMVGRRLGPRRS